MNTDLSDLASVIRSRLADLRISTGGSVPFLSTLGSGSDAGRCLGMWLRLYMYVHYVQFLNQLVVQI